MDEVHNCSSITYVNGQGQKSQPHLHYQIYPFPKDACLRGLVSKEFNIPFYPNKTNEELKAMADKLRQ